jgi:hypothetical protein
LVGQEGRHGNIRIQTGDMQPISTTFDRDLAQIIGCRLFQTRQGGQWKADNRAGVMTSNSISVGVLNSVMNRSPLRADRSELPERLGVYHAVGLFALAV